MGADVSTSTSNPLPRHKSFHYLHSKHTQFQNSIERKWKFNNQQAAQQKYQKILRKIETNNSSVLFSAYDVKLTTINQKFVTNKQNKVKAVNIKKIVSLPKTTNNRQAEATDKLYVVKAMMQYPKRTLKDEIMQRRKTNSLFSQQQLILIISSLCDCLREIQKSSTYYFPTSLQQIFLIDGKVRLKDPEMLPGIRFLSLKEGDTRVTLGKRISALVITLLRLEMEIVEYKQITAVQICSQGTTTLLTAFLYQCNQGIVSLQQIQELCNKALGKNNLIDCKVRKQYLQQSVNSMRHAYSGTNLSMSSQNYTNVRNTFSDIVNTAQCDRIVSKSPSEPSIFRGKEGGHSISNVHICGQTIGQSYDHRHSQVYGGSQVDRHNNGNESSTTDGHSHPDAHSHHDAPSHTDTHSHTECHSRADAVQITDNPPKCDQPSNDCSIDPKQSSSNLLSSQSSLIIEQHKFPKSITMFKKSHISHTLFQKPKPQTEIFGLYETPNKQLIKTDDGIKCLLSECHQQLLESRVQSEDSIVIQECLEDSPVLNLDDEVQDVITRSFHDDFLQKTPVHAQWRNSTIIELTAENEDSSSDQSDTGSCSQICIDQLFKSPCEASQSNESQLDKYSRILASSEVGSFTGECSHEEDDDCNGTFTVEEYEGGSKYEGYVRQGVKNGFGKLYYQDGGSYEGSWKNGEMEGFGKLYYQSGDLAYEGYWKKGQFHGLGKIINQTPLPLNISQNYKDLSLIGTSWKWYEGNFEADNKNGHGTLMLENGQKVVGNWVNNQIHGEGQFFMINGSIINGHWSNNKYIEKQSITNTDLTAQISNADSSTN